MSKSKKRVIAVLAAMAGFCLLFAGQMYIDERDAQEYRAQHATPDPAPGLREQAKSDGHGNTWRTTFIRGYQERMGWTDPSLSQRLIENAQVLCVYLDNDESLPYAFTYGTDKLHMSSDQTVVVIEEAITAHCTQHQHLLDGE